MAVVKRTQVINKAVDVVFQTVVDVANFPKWKRGYGATNQRYAREVPNCNKDLLSRDIT